MRLIFVVYSNKKGGAFLCQVLEDFMEAVTEVSTVEATEDFTAVPVGSMAARIWAVITIITIIRTVARRCTDGAEDPTAAAASAA